MHSFPELIERCTFFALHVIGEAEQSAFDELDKSGATQHVVKLQMLQLQKVVIAVGMFSIFESHLQQSLGCTDGFIKAKSILKSTNNMELLLRFDYFCCSINVLKHGRGKSYDRLLAAKHCLPFQVKDQGESFFDEGDVSEVMTLIKVDDVFLDDCAKIIREVNDAVS